MSRRTAAAVGLTFALLAAFPWAEAAQRDPGEQSHCDVAGTVLLPQGQKQTAAVSSTTLGGTVLNGITDYRTSCAHPGAAFTLTYTSSRPLLAADCSMYDFDILFWPEGGSDFTSPVGKFRACGDEAGTVPGDAAYATVLLVRGVPGASFSYDEG